MKKYNCGLFIAREPGLTVLKNHLLQEANISIRFIATHKYLPKFQGEKIREEYYILKELANFYNIDFYSYDFKENYTFFENQLLIKYELDFIYLLSWRKLISKNFLSKIKYGGINLHRGKIPDYSGDFPVERAYRNQEKKFYLCGLDLSDEIDGGNLLYFQYIKYDIDKSLSDEKNLSKIYSMLSKIYIEVSKETLKQFLSKIK